MKAMALATGAQEVEMHEMGVDDHYGDRTSKAMSEKLALTLSEKVSLLTILLVCLIPIIHFDRYPTEDYSMKAWTERLESSYAVGYDNQGVYPDIKGEKTFAQTVETMKTFYKTLNYFPVRLQGFPEHVSVDGHHFNISGQQLVNGAWPPRKEFVARVFVEICEAVRPECDMDHVVSKGVYQGYNAKRSEDAADLTRAAVYFNFQEVVKMTALTDILTILLVLGVMIYFSHDVTRSLRGILMTPMPGYKDEHED